MKWQGRHFLRFKKLSIAVVVTAALVALFVEFDLDAAESTVQGLFFRPQGVSKSAHYVPNDGKNRLWFDCSVDKVRQVNHCRAWDPGGRLLGDDDFSLDEEKRMASPSELRPASVRMDRGSIYLICLSGPTDACEKTLIPVRKR
ncbi:hypothetical protein [Paludibaculum fermentans]|uniref:hypothetical protein n=1 Tax=Paludibaculum fermentans TaxID=1473598 RepID=UPI003EBAF1CE